MQDAWTRTSASSHAREEALFLHAVKQGLSLMALTYFCGTTLEETAAIARRLIFKGRLSPQSKYAKLRVATRSMR